MAVIGDWETLELLTYSDWTQNWTHSFSSAPAEGELILMFASIRRTDSSGYNPSFPAGFTTLGTYESTWRRLWCAYKVAGASEGTDYTLTRSNEHWLESCAYRISGPLDTANPMAQIKVVHGSGSVSSVSATFDSNTESGALAVAYYHSHNAGSGTSKTWNTAEGWGNIVTWGYDDPDEKQTSVMECDGSAHNATVTLSSGTNDRQSIILFEVGQAAADTTPDQFTFTDQNSVEPGTVTASNTITVAGMTADAAISVSGDTGAEYRIEAGSWTSSAGTVSNGEDVQVRVTSSASFNTVTSATLDIGGVTDTFTVTTRAADTTPDAFSFTDQTGAAINSTVVSDVISVDNIEAAASISISSAVTASYRINSGSWTSSAGTVNNSDTVDIQLATSGSFSTATSATLTIGGVQDTFSVTTEAEDTTPDAFAFTDQTGVALDTVITSAPITVAGINSDAVISVTGGTQAAYSINGGSFTASSGTVSLGDEVRAQVRSSASNEVTTNATVTIGGVADTFSVTTEPVAPDTTPDAFAFTDQTDVEPSGTVDSNTVTITGINTATAVSISGETGAQYKINAGSWVSSAGNVNVNDTVTLRLPTSDNFNTQTSVMLDVGGVTDTFAATTRQADTTPDAFSFTDQTGVPLNTTVTSNAITLAGVEAPAAISISGETGCKYRVNAGAWVSSAGTINNGETAEIQLPTSSSNGTQTSATLTIGGVSDTFSATTISADTTPDAFSFTDQTDVEPGVMVMSNAITVAGINAAAAISISGESGSQYRINGGAWTSSAGTVNNGNSVDVRVPASSSFNTLTSATLDIGGVFDTFSVTTASADTTPDAFTFTDQSGADLGVTVASIPVTITGINTDTAISISGEPGSQYRISGGAWTSSAGTITSGQTIEIQLPTSATGNTTTSATVTIGGVSDTFSVTTKTDSSVTATEGDTDVPVGVNPGYVVDSIILRTVDSSFSATVPFGASHTDAAPTFDMPDLLTVAHETDWVPYDTASYGLQIEVVSTDPQDTNLIMDLTRNLPAGYGVVEVSNVSTDADSVFYGIVEPLVVPANTSQVVYATANNTTVDATGVYTTDQENGFINLWIWRQDTGQIEFEQIYIPGRIEVTIDSNPVSLQPNTQYTATIINGTGIFESGKTYSGSLAYPVVINSASMTSVTFTTAPTLPVNAPVDFSFTYQTR